MAGLNVGQRLMLTYDSAKLFTHKDEKGDEIQLQRVYHLDMPYGSPYEEVYSVLEDFIQAIKENEKLNKERAEKELKEKQSSVQEQVANL